jgi:uncharacterized protein (TIGR03067 family)
MYCLFIATLAISAPVPKALQASDSTRILGKWELTTATYSGQPYASAHGTKWTFHEDETATRDRPNEGIAKANYKLNATSEPKEFDWNTAEGNNFVGIYELNSDSFRVCLRSASNDNRPTSMDDTEGCFVFVFKRLESKS